MRAWTLSVLVAVAAITTHAAADDKSLSASGASGAPLSTLAAGSLPTPPRVKAPASIPASEKASGIFLAAPAPVNKRPQGWVMVVGNASAAKEVTKGSFGSEVVAGDACFTEQNRFHGIVNEDPSDPESNLWSSDLRASLTLSTSVERGERPSVSAVHAERIVTTGASVSLEATDAWIDPMTRGARLISKTTLPLTLVGMYPDSQQRVYAVRDGELVHVVLVRTMTDMNERRGGTDALFATAHETIGTSQCDHIRTTLRAKKGHAETASIVSTVVLAHLEKKPDASEGEARDARKEMIAKLNDMRSRPMHISPSVSWPTREREALLTVSAGWDARERNGFGGL